MSRYDQPVPRYTSYPTVPFWKEGAEKARWGAAFREAIDDGGISLYIHLPFCESLCIYCGCNKKITTNHSVEEEYLQAVLNEWSMYLEMMGQRPTIRELHLGGGTPTFFSPANLYRLLTAIFSKADIHPDHAFSVEGHPANTTREHLDVLSGLGFRRISYGVQDLNSEVQKAIHRIQSFEGLRYVTEQAREAGFTSVNFDLIYGLPAQTPEYLRYTVGRVLSLRPDRLAFYSYAHTPWLNCAQRLIDDRLMPSTEQKLFLYTLGRELLTEGGYTNIGMDHFALPGDELFKAWREGTLHRNFMGYTVRSCELMLGLGVSAISDSGTAFAQNDKTLSGYYRSVAAGELAVCKTFFLSEEDKVFRRHILDISCKGSTNLEASWMDIYRMWTLPYLRGLESDGLVLIDDSRVTLTEAGRPFLRHVCKAFDLHLLRGEQQELVRCGKAAFSGPRVPQFSSAI